jgi:lysosomal Pro-X carboxypeptidase
LSKQHRFYGESKPFGNESNSSPEKLGYLTSTQALADFAVLITSLKHNLSAVSSPVVVFGGSYGGMLASWFRLKYPHVTIGAVASSAPILQFDYITPWSSFYEAVSQDYKVLMMIFAPVQQKNTSRYWYLTVSNHFRSLNLTMSILPS